MIEVHSTHPGMNATAYSRSVCRTAHTSSWSRRCAIVQWHRQQQMQAQRQHRSIAMHAFTLERTSGGPPLTFNKQVVTVGSSSGADVQLEGPGVEPEHAKFTQKGKQLFLTALVGEFVFDETATWIDDAEARPGVAYVLSSGSTVVFGSKDAAAGGTFKVQFEEPTGSNPLVEMLMQGAAAGASAEVKQALTDASKSK